MLYLFARHFISKKKQKIGKWKMPTSYLFNREDRNDRQKTKDEINRRCQSDDPWEQFLIFPEGTTSNRWVS